MSYMIRVPMLRVTIQTIAFVIVMTQLSAFADQPRPSDVFEEHEVAFHNRNVKLAGSILLPHGTKLCPAVVFVHGAGRQTRDPYREVAEHFASHGIAALIYDKRGAGQSGGSYESYAPYENLVGDALAAVAFLKQHREIAPSQIGLWGLSQGAYISAAAASRSTDIKFNIAGGASVADGAHFFYRNNLFRRYGLSDKLRDLAEKAQLIQDTLPHNLRDESFLSTFAPRSYPPPDQYVHPKWSQVKQPVLAIWGQLDQHQPVGESIDGLKNSLAQANNDKWTFIILPRANHNLGISDAGELHHRWRGYSPETLNVMTEWVHSVIDGRSDIPTRKQVGSAPRTGILSEVTNFERHRWYGNGTSQALLWIFFTGTFFFNMLSGLRSLVTPSSHSQHMVDSRRSDSFLNYTNALSAFNFLIMVGMTITIPLVFDQTHPSCPAILMYLPLLGTISTIVTISTTIALLLLLKTGRADRWPAARRNRVSFNVLCPVLFIPYMFYWNLIGLSFL